MAKEPRVTRRELEAQISAELLRIFKPPASHAMEHRTGIETPYEVQFRSSRLPFCGREYVLHHRYREEKPVRVEDYGFNFYVKIGSAVHSVVQQFLGMSDFLYGDWTCCGVTDHAREGSELCSVCGRPQQYEELAPKSELGMHVDGVTVKYNAVTEFKTTSSRNVPSLSNPYPAHMVQASCYLHALNKEHGWSLDKLIFVYFSRDNPSEFRVFVRRPLDTVYEDTLALYQQARSDLVKGVLPDRTCETVSDGSWRGCPYTGICFHPKVEDMLIPVESLVRHGS